MGVAFENETAVSRPGVKRSCDQPPKAGADHQRIELSRHKNTIGADSGKLPSRTGYGIDLDQCEEFD